VRDGRAGSGAASSASGGALTRSSATGLTEGERERLTVLVKDIAAGGCAQILIEHDLELVGRLCHRVTVINQGHHVFTGTPAAAQVEPEVVRAYLGMNQLISGGADDARG